MLHGWQTEDVERFRLVTIMLVFIGYVAPAEGQEQQAAAGAVGESLHCLGCITSRYGA